MFDRLRRTQLTNTETDIMSLSERGLRRPNSRQEPTPMPGPAADSTPTVAQKDAARKDTLKHARMSELVAEITRRTVASGDAASINDAIDAVLTALDNDSNKAPMRRLLSVLLADLELSDVSKTISWLMQKDTEFDRLIAELGTQAKNYRQADVHIASDADLDLVMDALRNYHIENSKSDDNPST